ncbi:Chitinase 2 [Lecanora helva]
MHYSAAVVALFASAAIAAPWHETPISNGTASATKTLYSTKVYTVTSCAPTITECPAHSTHVKTEVVSVTTTVCPVTATPIITESVVYSTKYSTKEITITACPETVTSCPASSTIVQQSTGSPSLVPVSTVTITTLIPTASVTNLPPPASITAVPTVAASTPVAKETTASEEVTSLATSVATYTSCPAGASSGCPVHTYTKVVATVVPTIKVYATASAEASSAPVQEATSAVVAPSQGFASGSAVFNTTAPSSSPIAFTGAASSMTVSSAVLAGVAVFGAMLAL